MLSRIGYYLFILPLSWLPHFILYRVSDGIFILLYYLVGYRKKVVLHNLKNAFPEKTEEETLVLRRKFYRHFCDLILESFKNFSISESEAIRRMKVVNPQLLDAMYDQKKNVIICGGHFNNWELWAVAVGPQLKHKIKAIYKPLSNAFFDAKMRSTRGRYGLELVSTKAVNAMFSNHESTPYCSVFAIDQSPGDPRKAFWIDFLNQETPCSFGPEKYAKEFKQTVVYGHIKKIKRGFYETEFQLIASDPGTLSHGEIIIRSHDLLEEEIKKSPQYWLWSHRRWKHNRPEDIAMYT